MSIIDVTYRFPVLSMKMYNKLPDGVKLQDV